MLFKSWKTTIIGLITGGLNLYANGTKWQEILLSIGLAALGGLAKDHDVTGGTK